MVPICGQKVPPPSPRGKEDILEAVGIRVKNLRKVKDKTGLDTKLSGSDHKEGI